MCISKLQEMKRSATVSTVKLTAVLYVLAVAGIVTFVNSCSKSGSCQKPTPVAEQTVQEAQAPLQQSTPQTKVVTVANIRKTNGEATEVMFNELAELFTVTDAGVLASLEEALAAGKPVSAKFDPWTGVVQYVSKVSDAVAATYTNRQVNSTSGTSFKVDLANTDPDVINNTPSMAVLNTTSAGLTNVVPDMATAQAMFNYITKQCCAVAGPYAIDHCISFQYCQDGCYARAHKMCWILNNTYHYATHKIFSFANSGSDQLSVQCQKWGGCCVRWWYHVAPLVNIKTTTGVKAFVFDPAMFDQPVLLATWLHAQENPACISGGHVAHVSMINIQPTTSYSPSSYSGLTFDTDPFYSSTNSTLVSYSPLHTCP